MTRWSISTTSRCRGIAFFVYRDTDVCRQQFHETQGHSYQNYQAQIRLSVKIKFLAGLARRLTEAIGTTKIPSVSEKLGYMAAQASMVEAMLSGMEASGSKTGEYWVPNKHFMYSAQVLTQDLYPQFVNAIRELSGGALIMLPSSIKDFKDPLLKQDHPHHPARRSHGAGRQGQIPESLLGCRRLGVRFATPAI